MSLFLDIEKTLGSFTLRAHLEVENEVLGLVGNSGCGKSMTLRCIAGIERPDRGRIILDGTTLFDSEKHINLTPQQRHTGLLFQNYALFPNMTVYQNIRAGTLRDKRHFSLFPNMTVYENIRTGTLGKKQPEEERDRKVREIMESFGLTPLEKHLPRQLSGGQQQRTALARLMVSAPQILMLDEPFSALDSELKFHMEKEVGAVLKNFGKTAMIVTHDKGEAYRLCDRIAMMKDGSTGVILTKEEWLFQSKSVIMESTAIPQNVILIPKE